MAKRELTKIEKYNALSNAVHIFAYKEEEIKFKVLHFEPQDEDFKLVVLKEDGTVAGLFSDSATARDAFRDFVSVFGDETEQPFVMVKIRETKKGTSVYYLEVQEEKPKSK